MGSKQQSSSGSQNTTTTVTPAPFEAERNQLLYQQEAETMPTQTRNILSGLDLSNLLLTGQPLPGYLGALPGGIGESQTQSMVNSALNDITPSFQSSGLLDSGVRASISARTAADIRNQNAAFNMQNLQQLLNLAVGGQAQPFQAPIAYSGQLGASLAGLRSTNTQGTSTMQQNQMNPFLKSFQQSAGGAFGLAAPKIFGF